MGTTNQNDNQLNLQSPDLQSLKKHKIVLTGGGTAGHVSPNLALIPALTADNWEIFYIGSSNGLEKQLVAEVGLPYYGISSGKLRRYFSWQNFIDPFKVIKGIFDAYGAIAKIKPQVVFSKGGFVTVPVILASWLQRIPVIIHESDFSSGLANRLSLPFATKVCVTFPETAKNLAKYGSKVQHTGLPIRPDIRNGKADRGRAFCGIYGDLPVLFVVGGSTGSAKINLVVRSILDILTQKYQVVHACGKGHLDPNLKDYPRYCQFEYLGMELADVLAMADLVVSRSGANAIFEFLTLRKPNLLIPLSKLSSRGDQILNAKSFQSRGYSAVLFEEDLTSESLLNAIADLDQRRDEYIQNMSQSKDNRAIAQIVDLIKSFSEK
ncbi:MAG: undecaprenyldiphospho-muramoylpentapeptide beta-N-acetylglucosaminyltransferase [Pseudanabaena sp. M090S1SP1A06QC]|nr:undecaprenyldiphospho-muramoylpentapeptide beta-N-acetylglucosaminyltransferase [Pseudanabaena sp. M109S1SP1A06QC]MCA6605104.1 undecaprenyldiphospho-muramoylpentapeptide beta-N-acetylglucosaminyltransferase [Pseudanabaena sp. M007S1SP1A06QC]MCA6616121.1 undecaprenyldiphospho-muramoylpentapeptide beta-N-acetylglucosaminyltransferase [Pseudanabaena sp. M090S1SP1A06QC]MCE2977811.1 undecaprenyldiphospho-muramoylpentapeptide beta-N-acetylglucosaminyltransferase [Pseudanabaena sp. CoA8_M7]